MRTLTSFLLAALLLACSEAPPPAQDTDTAEPAAAPAVAETDPAAEPAATTDPVAAANEIYAGFFEASLRLNPLQATFIGDHRFNDQLPNFLNEEHQAAEREMHQTWMDRILAVDTTGFSEAERLNYDIFVRNRRNDLEGFKYPGHLIPINQFYNVANFFAQLGSGQSAQPFETAQHYRDWLARVDGFVVVFDQAIANMRAGIERGVVQPRVLMDRVIPQLEAHLVEDVEQSIFYRPLKTLPDGIADEEAEALRSAYRAAITEKIVPAYRELRDFIRDEYLPAARETDGMWDLPGGEDWYAYNVRTITTTELEPSQIHQIGLDEVARIHGEMRAVMDEVGFTGTLEEFFEFTRTDEQFVFETREALLSAYEDLRSVIETAAPDLFENIPQAQFEIRPVEPFREQSASGASYQRAAADGSRPGIFYVNTYDLSARPRWAVESLFLHEAIPGHHFQISIQQGLDLPKFRRFGGTTAFVEGWGLYAESLGRELGVYQDPYQYYGALAAELWRAIRLVVDTGLHAKKWSREQVLEYMYNNAPVAEARAVSEAERFMAIPGQALAYKIGQLKIRELRSMAEEALGADFDVRRFHTIVLEDGAIPLDVLEEKVERWIESQRMDDTASGAGR